MSASRDDAWCSGLPECVCVCLVRDWLVGQLVEGGAGASRRHLQVTTALGATQGDQKVTFLGLNHIRLHRFI